MSRALLSVVALILPVGAQMTEEKEIALGVHLLRNLEKSSPALSDTEINGYVTDLAKTLSANCAAGRAVTVRILVNSEVNAFALPARFLVIHTELLRRVRSEAALAGILAQIFFQSIASANRVESSGEVPLIFGNAGYPMPEHMPIPGAMRPRLRASVEASDARAARCLADAGYDPREFLDDLRNRSIRGEFHAERVQLLESRVAELPVISQAIVSTSAFAAMHRRLNVLVPGPNPPSLRVNLKR